MRILLAALLAFLTLSLTLPAATRAIDPDIKAMVDAVSEQHIEATLRKLEAFGTRNVHTNDASDTVGIGAARRWIFAQLQSYSPRLEVRFDTHKVKKQGRIQKDIELVNVVAVLPGTSEKERQIVVSGHYDSLAFSANRTEDSPPSDEATRLEYANFTRTAPGVTDDGSGTAAVMELARVMSGHQFRKTIVFIAFAGEEMGLIGSTLYAENARKANDQIEAVLNNDIIGSEVSGNGFRDNGSVRVFSEDPNDSPSRQLARYIQDTGARYFPAMRVDMIFRADRFSRGGDHTPFNQQQFAAVRFTTPAENFANQHSATDTFANTSVPYATRVAKVNIAAAANLAQAPKTPVTDNVIQQGERKGQVTPMIARGKSRYDAVLKWKNDQPERDLDGYIVVERSTQAPDWEHETYVGNVLTYTFENVSIDDRVFGIKAIDKSGHESQVAPYVFKPRALRKIETY